MARVLIELAQYWTSAAPRTPSRSPVEGLIEAETASAASHCTPTSIHGVSLARPSRCTISLVENKRVYGGIRDARLDVRLSRRILEGIQISSCHIVLSRVLQEAIAFPTLDMLPRDPATLQHSQRS